MFYGREKELAELREQFASPDRTAVLVYGKRRVGKSTLIRKAAEDFHGIVINHLCVQSTLQGNLELLSRSVCMALHFPTMTFATIMDLFDFLERQPQPILLILDEYPYLKAAGRKNEVDSYMQTVIDSLPANVKLVLCGSYITVMRELLEEENPLFGRFTDVLHLEEFDYYDAAAFYQSSDIRRKIANYAVFGGSPYVLSVINPQQSVAENVIRFLLPSTGLLRIYIENVMLKEIQKVYDVRIFEAIGNGRKKYGEIQSGLNVTDSGLLDKQLKILLNMEAISKVSPINKLNDRRKQFYVIQDNLMRFYFTYVFNREAQIVLLGEKAFYEAMILPSLEEFVSRRFEDIAVQYFSRLVKRGDLRGIYAIGSYWYDDPVSKTNGEFDCVLKKKDGYDFYECKYYSHPMSREECAQEEQQVRAIPALPCNKIGFICSAGFDFKDDSYDLISGEDLYA
jgi:AAA+ ATPase superfamily predicted ATPase